MQDIDRAARAQEWLMRYYRQWIPLDACLELVHYIDAGPEEEPAENDDDPGEHFMDDDTAITDDRPDGTRRGGFAHPSVFDDPGEHFVDDDGRPKGHTPQTCHTCRFGELHTINGNTHTQGPTERYFTCARGLETCNPDEDPSLFQCAAWRSPNANVWAHREW